MSLGLWLPNHNAAFSARQLGADRLTLRTNWGQMALVGRDFAHFFGPALLPFLGMDCMRCASRARKIEAGGALARLVSIAIGLIGIMSSARGQSPRPRAPPPPPPTPTPIVVNSMVSSGAAVTNLGSNCLERLGNQSNGFNRLQRTNPGGGGASGAAEGPRCR